MPRKSPKKKGKKGKGKKTKQKTIPIEHTRSYNEARVAELKALLNSKKTECAELEEENDRARQLLNQEKEDKEDIASYLQLQNRCQEAQIDELAEDIAFLQTGADERKRHEEADFYNLENHAQHVISTLNEQCDSLELGISKLSDYQGRKDQLEKGSQQIKKEIHQKRLKYSSDIYFLERRIVETNSALKQEMKNRVDEVAVQYREVSNAQLKETTKATVVENLMVSSELISQTEQTKALMVENEKLRRRVGENDRKIEVLEELERKTHAKESRNERAVRHLAEQSNYLQMDTEATREAMIWVNSKGSDAVDLLEKCKNVDGEHRELLAKYRRLVEDEKGSRAKLAEHTSEAHRLRKIIDKCALDLADHEADQENRNSSAVRHVMPLLAAASKGTVKNSVQKTLGQRNVNYQRGCLGLVSKD